MYVKITCSASQVCMIRYVTMVEEAKARRRLCKMVAVVDGSAILCPTIFINRIEVSATSSGSREARDPTSLIFSRMRL
jgi:hypothetical protein